MFDAASKKDRLRPVASLNPVTDPVTIKRSPFFKATSAAKPASVSEQYKALSAQILTEGSHAKPLDTAGKLAPIAILGLLLTGWASLLVRRFDYSEEAVRD